MSSSTSLAKQLSVRLAKVQAQYNPFTSIRPENNISAQVSSSTASPITLAIKDNIATLDEPTTCSSQSLAKYTSPFEATVVSILRKSLNPVIVGKTNLDEFGMGAGTTNSIFGPTYNPLFPGEKRICGGSSGGSAAAVASGAVDIALGTDTGGSVRQPAALTGVYGFKPTYGRLSRWGVIAYAQSLDTVGILGRNLELIEEVYKQLDKYDYNDPTSMKEETRLQIKRTQAEEKHTKLRVGVPKEFIIDNLTTEVSDSLGQALSKLSEHCEIVPVSIPSIKLAVPIYFTLTPAEAASNLARYDGVRYGHRSIDDRNNYAITRSSGFGKVVQERIILGNFNLNADSYKNHFLKAKKLRSQLRAEFNNVFRFPNHVHLGNGNPNGVDLLIGPTTMRTAQTIEDYGNQAATECFIDDALVIPASLAGLPAISVPWFNSLGSVPIGLQLIGQHGDDNRVLKIAKTLELLNK